MNTHRMYYNKQSDISITIPTKEEFTFLYKSLKKHSVEDFLNCNSCGYKDCETMAVAIHNKKNSKENCIFFRAASFEEERDEKKATIDRLSGQVSTLSQAVENVVNDLNGFVSKVQSQLVSLQEISQNTKQTVQAFSKVKDTIQKSMRTADQLQTTAHKGAGEMKGNAVLIHEAAKEADSIQKLITVLDEIANKTNILSINASIEAANSGHKNNGFKVVANEIRKLAGDTFVHIENMADTLNKSVAKMKTSKEAGDHSYQAFLDITNEVAEMNQMFSSLGAATMQLERQTMELEEQVKKVSGMARDVQNESDMTQSNARKIHYELNNLFDEKVSLN